jgi:hypothetical protein
MSAPASSPKYTRVPFCPSVGVDAEPPEKLRWQTVASVQRSPLGTTSRRYTAPNDDTPSTVPSSASGAVAAIQRLFVRGFTDRLFATSLLPPSSTSIRSSTPAAVRERHERLEEDVDLVRDRLRDGRAARRRLLAGELERLGQERRAGLAIEQQDEAVARENDDRVRVRHPVDADRRLRRRRRVAESRRHVPHDRAVRADRDDATIRVHVHDLAAGVRIPEHHRHRTATAVARLERDDEATRAPPSARARS